jgi:hypothetical protein
MKKTLTIILLSISLSGFSQTEKGDWVITPMVGWNTVNYDYVPGDYENLQSHLPIGFHKYLNDRLSVGFVLNFRYGYNQPYVVNRFYRSQSRIYLEPEIRYNFLKTRFTPFVAGRILSVGYINDFGDNPALPPDIRRITYSYFNAGFQIDAGVSYFIKDRFGMQVKLMSLASDGLGLKTVTNFYTPINFGLQFIINNPRSEIESPR